MVWGWLIAMIPIQCIACSLAELCSAMPTSGGLYYASAVLAPQGYGPLAAWITGWSNWVSQVSGVASVDYALASMILAGVSILKPSYTSTNVHTWLLSSALMVSHASIASLSTRALSILNAYGTVLNFCSLLAVIILIPLETTRTSQMDQSTGKRLDRFSASRDVWGNIHNVTDHPDGISVLMSFVAVIWIMTGYDAPFHISEECSNANLAAPRAIVVSDLLKLQCGTKIPERIRDLRLKETYVGL